jgi:hypothetical protein
MTAEYCRSMREILRGISWQSARENNDVENILQKFLVVDRLRGRLHYKYSFTLTPDTGLFKLVVRAPTGWPGSEGVTFLFSYRDLYMCGYQNNVTLHWHIYDDAILPGIDKPRDFPELFKILPFGGGYGAANNVGMVIVGLVGFASTCEVIANCNNRSQREIRIAMLRMAACISEPLRFPFWMKKIVKILYCGQAVTVDGSGDNQSGEFRQWSRRSRIIRKGEGRFEESESEEEEDDVSEDSSNDKEFPRYECYLKRGVLLSRPPV